MFHTSSGSNNNVVFDRVMGHMRDVREEDNELDATDERMLMSTVLSAHADETKTAIHEVDGEVHAALGQQYGNTHFGGTTPEEIPVELELCGTGETDNSGFDEGSVYPARPSTFETDISGFDEGSVYPARPSTFEGGSGKDDQIEARQEARYEGGRKFRSGKIEAVNSDGTFAVLYDDGDKDSSVKAENIKLTAVNPAAADGNPALTSIEI